MTKDDKTFHALIQRLGEMVKENVELAQRVHELTDDYNRVVKQLQNNTMASNLDKTLNKVYDPECDCNFLKKKIDQVEKAYMDLFGSFSDQYEETKTVKKKCKAAEKRYKDLQHEHTVLLLKYDTLKAKLQKAEERCEAAEVNYNDLRQIHDEANFRIERFEQSEFVNIGQACPYFTPDSLDEAVKVGVKGLFQMRAFFESRLGIQKMRSLCLSPRL